MEQSLPQAYYWLFSAMAQGFAALIALSAMFFIYKMGIIRRRVDGIINMAREFLAELYSEREYPDIETGQTNPFLPDTSGIVRIVQKERRENYCKLLLQKFEMRSINRIMELIKNFVDDQEEYIEGVKVGEVAEYILNLFNDANRNPKILIISSIVASSFTMLISIFFLYLGNLLVSNSNVYLIMGGGSSLAALALGWTVFVVIKMLSEPKEPQAIKEKG